jgi:hypothetical protein
MALTGAGSDRPSSRDYQDDEAGKTRDQLQRLEREVRERAATPVAELRAQLRGSVRWIDRVVDKPRRKRHREASQSSEDQPSGSHRRTLPHAEPIG